VGLQLTEEDRIKMVLLDIDLPDLDGTVAATTLRARPGMNDVPITALTAQDSAPTRWKSMAFGCDGDVPKPIDTRPFPGQIAAYLKH
jgi:two-component system cell cycle response regulator DivK